MTVPAEHGLIFMLGFTLGAAWIASAALAHILNRRTPPSSTRPKD